MDYRNSRPFTAKRREFSYRSLALGAVFVVTAIVAVFVDLDGVLEYYKILSGAPAGTLEMGAFISIASAVPFLAMGMSVSADSYKADRGE